MSLLLTFLDRRRIRLGTMLKFLNSRERNNEFKLVIERCDTNVEKFKRDSKRVECGEGYCGCKKTV